MWCVGDAFDYFCYYVDYCFDLCYLFLNLFDDVRPYNMGLAGNGLTQRLSASHQTCTLKAAKYAAFRVRPIVPSQPRPCQTYVVLSGDIGPSSVFQNRDRLLIVSLPVGRFAVDPAGSRE